MSATIKFTGLKECQNMLNNYAKSMPSKVENFMKNLLNIGIPVVDAYYNTMGDSSPVHSTRVEIQNNGSTITATLWVEGEDLAFIEFGAGLYYNMQDHPNASEFGVGIGTYGKHQGLNNGWFYYDETGQKRFSRGTQMGMPVFRAQEEIINRFYEVARESFGV